MRFGKTTLFLCVLLLTLATFVSAQEEEEQTYNSEITFFAGGFLGDSVVVNGVGPLLQPVAFEAVLGDDFIGGARLTYYVTPVFGVEGGIGFTPASIASSAFVNGGSAFDSVISVDTYIFNANVVARLMRGRVEPFVTGGVAAVHFSFDTNDFNDFNDFNHFDRFNFNEPSETDFAWNIGGGIKVQATETVFFRLDGRYYQANSEFTDNNLEFTEVSGGLSIRFNF